MTKKKKLVFRTAKLLSDSRKSRIDSGIAIAYEHQPEDLDEKKKGSLFAVVEIDGNTSSSQEIAELIVNTLHDEYYRDIDRDPLESFEGALSKINEELADITDKGKIHWLGKLNAVLGVISDNTLHVTQSGSAEAYLFRGKSVAHISKDLAGDNVNPLRTFINIASGDLTEDDRVGLFTPAIFYHISKEELQKYVTEFNPNTAISHIGELLENLNGQRRSSALIIEALTPEALSNYVIDDSPDEVWIQESKRGVEAVTKSATPVVLTAGQKTISILGKISNFLKTVALPFVVATVVATAKKIKSLISNYTNKVNKKDDVLLQPKEALSSSRYEETEIDEPEETVVSNDAPVSNQVSISESDSKKSLMHSTFKTISTGAKRTKQVVKLPGNGSYKKFLIIGIGAVLVIGIIFSITGKIGSNKEKAANDTLIEATTAFDDGENLLILDEKESALSKFDEAKKLIEELKSMGLLESEADVLLAKINEKIEKALGTTPFNGELLTDLNSVQATGLLGIHQIGSNLYAVNSNTGAVYEISLTSGEIKGLINDFNFDGKPIATTAVEGTEVIVILTDEPSLYEFDPSSKEYTKYKVSGDLEKGNSIASFGSNVYILSPENETLYKHTKISGGYGQKTNWIKNATGSNAISGISVAIDGSIYILSNDGTLAKFNSGTKDSDFSISGLPQSPSSESLVYTNESIKGLYILDRTNNAVIIIDENNKFVKQIKSSQLADLKGAYVDANNVLHILAGTKIYKITQ